MFHTDAFDEIVSKFSDSPSDSPSDVPEARRPINGAIDSELGALAKEITLSSLIARTPQEPYFSIAHILRDALRQKLLVPTVSATDERWIEAIRIALSYNERKDPQTSATFRPQAADVTFAHAVGFFNARNINVDLHGDQIIVQSSGVWSALAATVAGPLMALGDTVAMKYLDEWLSSRFDPVIRRVHLHPTPDMMGQKLDRSLPCGHLYRTAIKVLGRRRIRGQALATPASIGEAATHLAALYEVEPFSTYETMFPPYPSRVFEMLLRVVLYDELFTIPQCDPAQMERLMRDLFVEVSKAGTIPVDGWLLDDAIALWRTLLSLSSSNATSHFIERSQLRRLLTQGVGRSASDALLDAFVLSAPNRSYRVPSDAILADTRECALVEASDGRYWIAPRPFLGPAFFARLVSLYAKVDKGISSKIGVAFEAQMLDRMTQFAIQCRRAEVAGPKGTKGGDIDLILETPEIVALFELKKKGLTRKTNAGNDLQLAIDLARGVVRGFNQLARHELTLLRSGELRFADGTKLSLNGRRIIKCVISLADYGGLHDGAVVRNMLESFRQISLSPSQSLSCEQQAGLEEANEQMKILQLRYAEFAALQSSDSRVNLFDNFLFHNVFFVEHVLLAAQTAESLLQALLTGHRLVTGSRDPFFEHAWFQSGRN